MRRFARTSLFASGKKAFRVWDERLQSPGDARSGASVCRVASLREAPGRGLAATRVFPVGYAISPLG
jgi:hypothetical protein